MSNKNIVENINKLKLINESNIQKEPLLICSIEINNLNLISDFYGIKMNIKIFEYLKNTIINMYKERECKFYYDTNNRFYIVDYGSDNKKEYEKLIKKIQKEFLKKEVEINGVKICLRTKIGISFSENKDKLKTSKIALYISKEKDLDYYFYEKEDGKREEMNNKIQMISDINKSLKNGGFVPFFQPIVCNKTLKVVKYEVLARMIKEDIIIPPYFFLEVSKISNQYHKITREMVLKSFKEFEFREENFSLNISYLDIKSNGFLKFIIKNIKKYNVGKKLVLELLEDEKIESEEVLNKFIFEVRKEGVKISIDDFGSGYSNFGRLVKLKIDYLKIDSELIKDLEKENNYKIVKGIVEFSKSLNLEVVAEYVENEKIFNIVKELGIHFSQGYYFSKPLQRII